MNDTIGLQKREIVHKPRLNPDLLFLAVPERDWPERENWPPTYACDSSQGADGIVYMLDKGAYFGHAVSYSSSSCGGNSWSRFGAKWQI